MDDSLSKALATPREISLNGSVYKITPITLNDLAAYEQHCKDGIRESLLSLKDIDKKDIIREIIAAEREGIDIDKSLGSMSGVRYLFWRCLLKEQPDMKIEQAGALVTMNNMDVVSSLMTDAEDSVEDDKKKQMENPSNTTSSSA